MNTLQTEMQNGQRVLLVGPPGCAKTARITATATNCNRKVVVMRASLSERVDFSGCMVPDVTAGITRSLPLDTLAMLQSTEQDTLLFLDDLGQAPIDVQASCMRLFDIGALSTHVLIWGATNRPGDKAGVSALCEPLRSRFDAAYAIPSPCESADAKISDGACLLGTPQSERESWLNWAMDNGAPAEVIAWHQATGGTKLYQWRPQADPSIRMPDYRSWAAVIRRWNCGMRDLQSVSACLGKASAAEFLSFASLSDKIPTPDQVWIDPSGATLPEEASAQWLVCCTLANAVTKTTASAFVTYVARFPRMLTAFAARSAFRRLGATLSASKPWVKWWQENKELFEV